MCYTENFISPTGTAIIGEKQIGRGGAEGLTAKGGSPAFTLS